MTSLVVWAGVDTRGVASLNIATDSRFTWTTGAGPSHVFDQGKKVFASQRVPVVVGFCGDVLFPTLAIQAVVEKLDNGFIADADPAGIRYVAQSLRALWKNYPEQEQRDFSIYIASRDTPSRSPGYVYPEFRLTALTHRSGKWSQVDVPMPENGSATLRISGSGAGAVRESMATWDASESGGTSRAVFSAFVEAIASGADPSSGGAPQLGSLYRKDPGRLFGIVHKRARYFAGTRLTGTEELDGVEWRNSLFERTDGRFKRRLTGAQRH